MRTPYIALISGGTNLIPTWGPLLVEMRITDERGTEADKLEVVLDDAGGQIVYPQTGEKISTEGGYRETGAALIGEYIVDQVILEGWPQRIVIQASSVDAKSAAKQRRTETHKATEVPTLGDLANKIAGRNGWTAAVAEELASIPIEEAEHQTEEDDLQFLTRLFKAHDGLVAIKQNRLIIMLRGSMKSASGAALPAVVIQPGENGNLLSYRVSWSDKPVHGKVEARYFDRLKVEPVKVEVPVGDGGSDVVKKIEKPFPTEAEAKRAAEAKARELTRDEGSATFEIEGDPSVGAEIPVQAQGIRSGVNGTWVPTRVEHSWTSGGYTTRIECEPPGTGDSRGDDAPAA